MTRSGPEVADVFRRYGEAYRERHDTALPTAQRRVMTAIERCLWIGVCLARRSARYPIGFE